MPSGVWRPFDPDGYNADARPPPASSGGVLAAGYRMLFGQQWPAWVGGILFGVLSIALFAWEKPWSVADGVRNWGDWLFNAAGITDTFIIDPHLYSTSVLNLGIIGGAFAAALLARQFHIRGAPPWELFKGIVGGCLMGVGASLSFGCNIGGFFSATSALSLAGPMMMLGLMAGAVVGLKLLVWEVSYLDLPDWMSRPGRIGSAGSSETWRRLQPLAGVGVLVIGAILALVYDDLDYTIRVWLTDSGRADRLGEAVFLPDYVGWEMALGAVVVLMATWYLCMTWNERKQRIVMM